MNQGRRMEHFDDRAQADAALARAAERLGREKKKKRPNSLATAGDQVPCDVSNNFNLGGRLSSEILLDRRKIVTQQIKDFRCGRDGERTHL